MMGYGADKGIIPLTCNELFVRLEAKAAADTQMSFTVEVSYIEVRPFLFSIADSFRLLPCFVHSLMLACRSTTRKCATS